MNRQLLPRLILLTLCWIAIQGQVIAEDRLGAVIETRPEGITQAELEAPTQVITLGTGTPVPDAYRAGPGIAVVYKGESYLFDAGSGVVHRAMEARAKYDIPSLYPPQISGVFFTHLHNDHTLDYVELAQVLWWRRPAPLKAFGPRGLNQMTEGLYQLSAPDIRIRTSGSQPVPNPHAYKVDATEIEPGIVFEKDGLVVEAFNVPHGGIRPAFGYKITTPDKTIVISGDTALSTEVAEKAKDADILFHEVISDAGLARNSEFWQEYHKKSHTIASDLGKLAEEAGVKKLVLYHLLTYGVRESLAVEEVQQHYSGEVVLAEDLDRF